MPQQPGDRIPQAWTQDAILALVVPTIRRLIQRAGIGDLGGDPIDHGSLGGLADDDHAQYLLADGTRDSTGAQTFLGVTDSIRIAERIVHDGDTDTYIRFQVDSIELFAGGIEFLLIDELAPGFQDEIVVNPQSSDVDFAVFGASGPPLIQTIASTNRVGLGLVNPDSPLQVVGNVHLDDDLLVDGEIQGSRLLLTMGLAAPQSPTFNLDMKGPDSIDPGVTQGYRMMRTGSVVGVSIVGNVTSHSVDGTLFVIVEKNGASVFSASVTITGVQTFAVSATQARGLDTFLATDRLLLHVLGITGTWTIENMVAVMEIVYDT